MKKIFILLVLVYVSLFAELKNSYMTKDLLKTMPIVDVRTPGEWRETGLLKGAIPIMFFNEQGKYDINAFLTTLNKKINTKKPFAIICHTGSRTSMIAPWMSKQLGYKVTNIVGGMEYATKKLKLKTYPYKR